MTEFTHICVTTASVRGDRTAVITLVLDVASSVPGTVKLSSQSKFRETTARAHHGLLGRLSLIVGTRLGVTATVNVAAEEGHVALCTLIELGLAHGVLHLLLLPHSGQ